MAQYGGIVSPVYAPPNRVIQAITNANPALVTTYINHTYITGTIIRLDIPSNQGMTQADQQFGIITVVSPTTFTIPINTTNFDVFTVPSSGSSAQAVPFGEDSAILTAAVQNILIQG